MLSSSATAFKPNESSGDQGPSRRAGGPQQGGYEPRQDSYEVAYDSGRAMYHGGPQDGPQRYRGDKSKQGRTGRRPGNGERSNVGPDSKATYQSHRDRTNSLGLSMSQDGAPLARPAARDRRDPGARQDPHANHPMQSAGYRTWNQETADDTVDIDSKDATKYRQLSNYVEAEQTMRNDLALHFTRSGEWGANFIRGIELGKEAAEYPRLRRLMDAKRDAVAAQAHPPLYARFEPFSPSVQLPSPPLLDALPPDPAVATYASLAPVSPANPLMGLTTLLSPHLFDVVLIHPPPTLSWSQIISLPIRLLSAEPSFVFLHVGSSAADGLERGREAFLRWGFRRCEELVWLKTNKARKAGSAQDDNDERPDNLFVCQKEHYLMGIRGTVRRKTDNHFVHCNVDTDVIVWDPPTDIAPSDPTYPLCPPQLYDVIENFCLGTRRLELFGRPGTARRGWVTVGAEDLQEVDARSQINAISFDSARYKQFLDAHRDEKGRYVLPQHSEIESLRPKSPTKGGGYRRDASDPDASGQGAIDRSDSFRPPPGAPARFGTHQAAAAAAGGSNRRYSDRSQQSRNQRPAFGYYNQHSIYGPQMSPPPPPSMGFDPYRGAPPISPDRGYPGSYRSDYFQPAPPPMGGPYALQTPPYPMQQPNQPFFNPYAHYPPYPGATPPGTSPDARLSPVQYSATVDQRATMLHALHLQMEQLQLQEHALRVGTFGSQPVPPWSAHGYPGDGASGAYDGQPPESQQQAYGSPQAGPMPGPGFSPGQPTMVLDPGGGANPAAQGYWMPSGLFEAQPGRNEDDIQHYGDPPP